MNFVSQCFYETYIFRIRQFLFESRYTREREREREVLKNKNYSVFLITYKLPMLLACYRDPSVSSCTWIFHAVLSSRRCYIMLKSLFIMRTILYDSTSDLFLNNTFFSQKFIINTFCDKRRQPLYSGTSK